MGTSVSCSQLLTRTNKNNSSYTITTPKVTSNQKNSANCAFIDGLLTPQTSVGLPQMSLNRTDSGAHINQQTTKVMDHLFSPNPNINRCLGNINQYLPAEFFSGTVTPQSRLPPVIGNSVIPNHGNQLDNAKFRSSALPSPTIYPPTPPPSAPWVHPWYVGETQ